MSDFVRCQVSRDRPSIIDSIQEVPAYVIGKSRKLFTSKRAAIRAIAKSILLEEVNQETYDRLHAQGPEDYSCESVEAMRKIVFREKYGQGHRYADPEWTGRSPFAQAVDALVRSWKT